MPTTTQPAAEQNPATHERLRNQHAMRVVIFCMVATFLSHLCQEGQVRGADLDQIEMLGSVYGGAPHVSIRHELPHDGHETSPDGSSLTTSIGLWKCEQRISMVEDGHSWPSLFVLKNEKPQGQAIR